MSKFKEGFDGVGVDGRMKRDLHERIARDNKGAADKRFTNGGGKRKRSWRAAVVVAASVLALLMILPSYVMIGNALRNAKYSFAKALPVKSESKLTSLLNMTAQSPVSIDLNFGARKSGGNSFESDTAAPPAAPESAAPGSASDGAAKGGGGSGGNYSSTNVQVTGMDEGDLVKTDGEYIYRLGNNGFSIVKADNGELDEMCNFTVTNFSPLEMYVQDDLLIMVGGGYRGVLYYGYEDMMDGGYMSCFSYHTNVEIRVFDISDRTDPKPSRYFQIEGNYHTSRLSEEDGMLYFVVNYYNGYYYNNYDEAETKRPYYKDSQDGTAGPLPVEDIYYFKNVPNRSYMILGAIDLNDEEKEPDIKAYLSSASITYVSGESIYISTQQTFYSLFGDTADSMSYIARFSLADLLFKGSNTVKGTPKDRYCMDEYEGYLRVATSYGGWWSSDETACAVYVFKADGMKRVGRVTGIAPGESIDSATFSEDKGYISTSVRLIDPLFIIDFSDVENPKVSGGLKEDGISNYLKAIDGTDYVLGFGTASAPNQSGWNEKIGLKVQLYDMSGEEAVSVEELYITGNSSYAEVLSNPRALLYMYDEKTKTGLIGFAAERAGYSHGNNYSNYSYAIYEQGLYLYEFDAAAGTLKPKGKGLLSNFDTSEYVYGYAYNSNRNYNAQTEWEQTQNRYYQYVQRGVVLRGMDENGEYTDDYYIYTVSQSVIRSYRLDDLTEVDKVEMIKSATGN